MPITISCSDCGKKLSVKEELVGKKVRCPGCQATLTVTAPKAAAAAAEPAKPKAAVAAPQKNGEVSARAAAPPPPVDDDEEQDAKGPPPGMDEDEEDDRPKKKPMKDDDETDDEEPVAKKKPMDEEDEEEEPVAKKKKPRDEEEDEEEEPVAKKKKPRDEEEDEEEEPVAKKKKPRDEEEEDEEEPVAKKKKPRDEDEEEEERPKGKKDAKGAKKGKDEDEEDEDDRPKKGKGKGKPKPEVPPPMLQYSKFVVKAKAKSGKKTFEILDADSGDVIAHGKNATGFLQGLFGSIVYAITDDTTSEVAFTLGRVGFPFKKDLVSDGKGRVVGRFKSKILSLAGGFNVYDEKGAHICEIKGKLLKSEYKFLTPDGDEMGSVSKTWGGALKSMLSGAGTYGVKIEEDFAEDPKTKMIMLAATIAVETIFQKAKAEKAGDKGGGDDDE